MGFLDKLKDKAKEIKENNKNFGAAMKRMNNRANFYGNINNGIKNGDFVLGSYINTEGSGGVIYSASQDDYFFKKGDIVAFDISGKGPDIPVGNERIPSIRYMITFADGKKAQVDMLYNKVDTFKMIFGL